MVALEEEITTLPHRDSNVSQDSVSMRAFSISLESTRTLELALNKPRTEQKYKWAELFNSIQATYLLLLRKTAVAPRESYHIYAFCLSLFVTLDFIFTGNMMIHLFRPIEIFETYGIFFWLIYPLIGVISPLFGIVAVVKAQPDWLKFYMNINAAVCTVNFPLFVLGQMLAQDEIYYVMVMVILFLLKFMISFTCATIRAHCENPLFVKNQETL